jgi:hypothetical protein
MQVFTHGPGHCLDVVDDGLEVRTKRRTDGDNDEIVVGDSPKIGCGAKSPDSYVVGRLPRTKRSISASLRPNAPFSHPGS